MPQPKDHYDPNATDPNWKQHYYPSAVSGSRNSGGGNRDKRIDYLLQSLILAGVVGLVGVTLNLRDNMTQIKTFVTTKEQQNDREIARLDRAIDRHDERITSLEQGRRSSNSQSHYRQER